MEAAPPSYEEALQMRRVMAINKLQETNRREITSESAATSPVAGERREEVEEVELVPRRLESEFLSELVEPAPPLYPTDSEAPESAVPSPAPRPGQSVSGGFAVCVRVETKARQRVLKHWSYLGRYLNP